MTKNIQVGIVGGAGYTAGELIRILQEHPHARISFIYSTSQAGQPISNVHNDLYGDVPLYFSQEIDNQVDVLFLCLGHGHSGEFLKKHAFASHTRIIDLSNEFRLAEDANFEGRQFVYGLPELQKESIEKASHIANPGCFATAIQLALLPLAKAGLLPGELHVNAMTGSTGAGQGLSATTHFSWREGNISVYKAFSHQHLGEIGQSLRQLQNGWEGELNFIPVRGNFTRGIFATAYGHVDLSEAEAKALYESYYQEAAFTHLYPNELHLKQVVNTNKCLLQVERHGNKLLITSIIDNLVKGASGQAVQNMNLLFGLPEDMGLRLKASFF